MIMKRLTPEQAFQAFKENREIYTLQVVDPNMTVMELIQREDLVMFEDTPPQRETATHANETTTGGETPAETEKAPETSETG